MLKDQTLKNYAKLILKIGVNLQKGQGLEIACPVEKKEVALNFTEVAYEMGASIVRIRWGCEEIDRLNYEKADINALTDIPKWFVDSKNDLVKKGFCYVAISAENPSAFKDVLPERLTALSTAKSKALKGFSDAVMTNAIRWCVVSVPTYEWAKQIFPNSKNPEEELSLAIEKTMRLNCDNPLSAWEEHINTLDKRAKFLTDSNFEYLHFTSSNGTNLKVGLAKNHLWLSAKERAKDGIDFVANMPTEEIFTAPDRLNVEGVVKSSKPLIHNGQIIDGFSLTFKKGKVVDYSAKQGYYTLKGLIETDDGTTRIGEVALIGKNSPVSNCGILFYNTLFDENASCHLALGKGYPTTVKEGDTLSKKELKELGVNDSIEHVDFMIGTFDTDIVGVKENGEKVQIFKDGDWVI